MGLFRKSDELFELMSKSGSSSLGSSASGSRPNPKGRGSSSSGSRPTAPRGFGAPFETTQGFGRSNLFGRAKTGPDLFEVDGEALVIVEDGFDLETAAAEGKGFSIRPDTVVVGALLATGLLISAFLLGRTSGDETPKVATIVVNESADDTSQEGERAPEAAPAANQGSAAPAPAGQVIQPPAQAGQAIQPPAQQQPAAAQRPQARQGTGGATTVAASAKAPGRYELIVASTTPQSAKKLAEWFKQNALSPIYGRSDLEVIASSKGRVSIKGFQKTEGTVLKRVRATQDPLGGSGSFGDAYFKRARR